MGDGVLSYGETWSSLHFKRSSGCSEQYGCGEMRTKAGTPFRRLLQLHTRDGASLRHRRRSGGGRVGYGQAVFGGTAGRIWAQGLLTQNPCGSRKYGREG